MREHRGAKRPGDKTAREHAVSVFHLRKQMRVQQVRTQIAAKRARDDAWREPEYRSERVLHFPSRIRRQGDDDIKHEHRDHVDEKSRVDDRARRLLSKQLHDQVPYNICDRKQHDAAVHGDAAQIPQLDRAKIGYQQGSGRYRDKVNQQFQFLL